MMVAAEAVTGGYLDAEGLIKYVNKTRIVEVKFLSASEEK